MNLRKKVTNIFATSAILLGMTGGMALAQNLPTSGNDDAELNVVCSPAASVSVETGAPFEIDLAVPPGPGGTYTATGSSAEITVDLTCNDVEGWVVGTGIGAFNFDGTVPAGKAASFSGNGFLMTGGGLDSYTPGPTHSAGDGPPLVLPVVSPNFPFDIAMTTELILFDYSAPGISVASWNTSLSGIPSNVAVGTYLADLEVVLYVP